MEKREPISQVTNEDCMELMGRYPDKYFELAIVDPPYGIKEDGRKSESRAVSSPKWKNPKPKYTFKNWDNERMNKSYFDELKRVSKNQIIWGANHFIENLENANSSAWIVWYKKRFDEINDFSDCELAYTNFKKGVRLFHFPWIGFGAVNAKENRIHPTQKPVKLYEWILKNYAKEGDKILDTHLGSGSSRIAADKMGFDFYACELDRDYFEAQEKRFKEYKSQLILF
jgi:site-specific DNA-methyltransferase (adenine-specific)